MTKQTLSGYIQQWITIKRESYWPRCLIWHGACGLVLAVFLLLAALISPADLPLPDCRFLETTGLPCPTCGFTRAFHSLANGNLREAWRDSPLSLPLFFSIVVAIGWHIMPVLTGYRFQPGDKLSFSWRGRLILLSVIIALFLANWAYRLIAGNI